MSDNKYKFSAKRIDNGELIEFSLGDCIKCNDGSWVVDTSEFPIISIDPSTITPLFTTDKPDAWLFENVDLHMFKNLTYDNQNLVKDSLISDPSSVHCFCKHDGLFIDIPADEPDRLFFNSIYRVKAPGYSIDDFKINISSLLPDPNIALQPVFDEVDKFAKANSLVNNNGS